MLEQITERLDRNVERVRNLASLYRAEGQGRRGVQDTDVLRAAVVLLHAGMEDYLRSLLIWKVDTFGPDVLKEYRLQLGDEWKTTVALQDLHLLRGRSVDEIIDASVRTQIRTYQTFSSVEAVQKALKRCGIDAGRVHAQDYQQLGEMIGRRHHIVHHADRDEDAQGRGNHRTRSIGRRHVSGYLSAVVALRDFVNAELGA